MTRNWRIIDGDDGIWVLEGGRRVAQFLWAEDAVRACLAVNRTPALVPRTHPTGVIAAPIERAQCVPECTWLQTRQHAEGCQQ